jgi:transposase-like protein
MASDKKKRKPSANPAKYDNEARESFFLHWVKSRSIRATARKFNVAESTLHKIKEQDGWGDRFDKVIEKIRDKTDRKAATVVSKRLKAARAILTRVETALINGEIDPTVRDFVKLAEYCDEQEGSGPSDTRSELVINVVNNITTGTESDRRRHVGNFLAGIGVIDDSITERVLSVLHSRARASHGN